MTIHPNSHKKLDSKDFCINLVGFKFLEIFPMVIVLFFLRRPKSSLAYSNREIRRILEHLHRRSQNVSQNATGADFGLKAQNGPHRQPQNCTGAWASPINEPALPCRPLCGKIISGAPAHRGSANPTPGAPLAPYFTSPCMIHNFLVPYLHHLVRHNFLFALKLFSCACFTLEMLLRHLQRPGANGQRPSKSVHFLSGPEKSSRTARRILIALSAATQTWSKFGHSLHHRD
jgi:hypothetical protein